MSKFEFKLPDIGEGVTEGEIVSWLVQVGDAVDEDQDMVEVMTDKATVTIGAPKAGKVAELRGGEGDVVPVGDVLVVLDLDGAGDGAPAQESKDAAPKEEAPKEEASAPAKQEDSAAAAVGDIKESLPGTSGASDYYEEKPLAAPATRKLARELGVDLRTVSPSGKAGRVTREDVEAAASGGGKAAPTAAAPTAAPMAAPAPVPALEASGDEVLEERVPIRGIRKRIFESMARSKRTAAHFTYVDECECSGLKALRSRVKPLAEAEGVKLTFLPFVIKATVAALKKHPALNCLVDDSSMEMVRRKKFDIGLATATDAGLIVPVIRNADRLSILDLAREIDRLATDARSGKVKPEDLGGSSFTVTSLGKVGGVLATPVVNYPEVAILYIGEMKKKPVVKGDEIVVGDLMNLGLSFDHRIIDGHVGAAFAQEIIGMLQQPDRLILNMG